MAKAKITSPFGWGGAFFDPNSCAWCAGAEHEITKEKLVKAPFPNERQEKQEYLWCPPCYAEALVRDQVADHALVKITCDIICP